MHGHQRLRENSTSGALNFRGNLSLFDVRAFTRRKRALKTGEASRLGTVAIPGFGR